MTKSKMPNPADLLFQNLFEDCSSADSLALLSKGIIASRVNSDRLLTDVQYLIKQDRFCSARFLLTTAREEIAKAYILADACRLDFRKHQSVLRRLCRAFYDHVSKHAYMEVFDIMRSFSWTQAREIWDIETTRWWPAASPEDGEPDMPHDTYFGREYPLYVDYGDYDRRWLVPRDEEQKFIVEEMFGETSVTRTQSVIDRWRQTEESGFCSPDVLAIVNSHFKKVYINDNVDLQVLTSLNERTVKAIASKTGKSLEEVTTSELMQLPIYDFV